MQPRLEGHHQGEDAYEGRRRDQDPSHSFADLPVGVDGHAEQQSESDDLAHDRAVYQESGKAGEEDEATCREAQPWFYPRWPLSPATEDRAPNDECDPDAHSREHDSCGPNEAVVHWAPFLRCPVRRIGPTAEPTQRADATRRVKTPKARRPRVPAPSVAVPYICSNWVGSTKNPVPNPTRTTEWTVNRGWRLTYRTLPTNSLTSGSARSRTPVLNHSLRLPVGRPIRPCRHVGARFLTAFGRCRGDARHGER